MNDPLKNVFTNFISSIWFISTVGLFNEIHCSKIAVFQFIYNLFSHMRNYRVFTIIIHIYQKWLVVIIFLSYSKFKNESSSFSGIEDICNFYITYCFEVQLGVSK